MPQPNLFPETKWLSPIGSPTPTFWIEEIRIQKTLTAGEEHLIRKIPLQRGLNIIWAEAAKADESDAKKRGKGHSAGKTTLCRLIRYILGEYYCGNEAIRRRLPNSETLGNAWVIAQVIIGQDKWVVARQLYSHRNQFSLLNKSLDETYSTPLSERRKYEDFTDALANVSMKDYQVRAFDKSGNRKIQWLHILQWLSRDQESHLGGLLKWRSPESGSNSPDLKGTDPQLIVRALLGITNEKERNEIERRKNILISKQSAKEDIVYYDRYISQTLQEIESNSDFNEELPNIGTDLFVDVVRRNVEQRILAKQQLFDSKIKQFKLREATERHEKALGKLAIAENHRITKEQEEKSILESITLYSNDEEPSEEVTVAFLKSLDPDRKFCEIPVSTALFQCDILRKHRLLKEESPSEKELGNHKEKNLLYAKAELARIQKNLVSLKKHESEMALIKNEARTQLSSIESMMKNLQAEHYQELENLRQLSFSAKKLNQTIDRKQKADNSILTSDKKLSNSDDKLGDIQKKGKEQQANLNDIFHQICQFIKGNEARGTLSFSKQTLDASIYADGERDSGAYKALQCLIFDFTALLAKLHGIGNHPGFLLHDSPRESDMELSLYYPIFNFIHQLALQAPDSFQYIITTTEAPPKDFQNAPICALKLDGATAEGRLLRENLSG